MTFSTLYQEIAFGLFRRSLSSGLSSTGNWERVSSIARAKKSPTRMIREHDSKCRLRAAMKAASRDLAVDAGEEIRETRIAFANGIVGGVVGCTRTDFGWDRFA